MLAERGKRGKERSDRSFVVQARETSIDTRGGEEDREMERRARDREDRFAGEYRRGIFFCALFGFIFAAYRHRPPDRFSNEFREGVKSEGRDRERERKVQADRKRGEGGRVRDQRVGRSSPAYLRPTQITERARASPLGRTVVDERG